MANTEKNLGEKTGEVVRNGGIVAALIGIIGKLAELPLPNDALLTGGVIFVAGGEVFRRVSKPKK